MFANLDHFESLIDFLGKISQVFGANGLNDFLFLVGQGEGLTEIAIRQRLFWRPEQGLAELIADNRRRKKTRFPS